MMSYKFRKFGGELIRNVIDYLKDYTYRPTEQYFDSICPTAPNDVFVDCGGFDGDTTEQFIKRCPNFKRVWIFEPSEANLQKAKLRLTGIRDINFIAKGVSDVPGTLKFNAEAGSASAVSETGENTIVVTTIDNEINDHVTFIKMDLEGWELKALEGSRGHIERDHPKMAIAVYHRASDFLKIPEFVLNIRHDYKIYLRHYTEGWTETVMYFVPQKK
jgi:FkbM family methyltransferase